MRGGEKLGFSVMLSAMAGCRIESKEGGLPHVMVNNSGILKQRLKLISRHHLPHRLRLGNAFEREVGMRL
jgi:hypothetical protein